MQQVILPNHIFRVLQSMQPTVAPRKISAIFETELNTEVITHCQLHPDMFQILIQMKACYEFEFAQSNNHQ